MTDLDTTAIDDLVGQLERAAQQLRGGDLSSDAAASLVEDCAALAGRASVELERLSKAGPDEQLPGQETLL